MGTRRLRPALTGTVTYTVNGGGITFSYDMNVRENLPHLPRFGVRLTMPEGSENLSYFGFGPNETYQDKRCTARLGLFSGTVMGNYEPYVRPQENGAHADCRFAKVAGLHGQGLYFFGENFSFSASHFTPEQLTETAHAYELIPNKETTVILDLKQAGIGSHSCGPELAPALRFSETAFNYTLRILPAVVADVRPFAEMRVDY
jgi:beta-galactosidase